MPPARLQKIRVALTFNEIGAADPHVLSYPGLGDSGPSFGRFQADLHANPAARLVMQQILTASGMNDAAAAGLVARLNVACSKCPLTSIEQSLVLSAMASDQGRALIDGLDEKTFDAVSADVTMAMTAAGKVGKTLDDGAACLVALWSNMTGLPTTLDRWIGGETIQAYGGPCPPPAGAIVTQEDVETYLSLTAFFQERPRNLAHLQASVARGLTA
jgi:hypothetical protein